MMVDCNGDAIADMTWAEMIEVADALFAQHVDESCRRAKAMAAAVNAMPSWNCPY
jgi:hypothetical protein